MFGVAFCANEWRASGFSQQRIAQAPLLTAFALCQRPRHSTFARFDQEDSSVPSIPPPLPYLYAGTSGAPSRTNDAPTPLPLSWSPIVASASVAFALIVSVVAWIVTHPHKAPHPSEPATATVVLPQIDPPAPPPPPTVPVLAVTPAFHRTRAPDAIVDRFPLLEEEPPPLPPPPSYRPKPQPVVEAKVPQPVGERYGTQVLFLNNQATAADQARRDRKLLFVMHISGNFEDSCFT